MKTPVLQLHGSKVAGLRACSFVAKRLQQKCFPVKFAKFLEHLFWKNLWTAVFVLKDNYLY